MICPILFIPSDVNGEDAACLQAQCAWWDALRKRCAILTLAQKVAAIAEVVKK